MGTTDGRDSELDCAWGFVKHQTGVNDEVENEVLLMLVGSVSSPNWLDLLYLAVSYPPLVLVGIGVLGGARQLVKDKLVALIFVGADG